ncbi:MAG: hypothetical protein ACYC6O_07960 [Thermoleophilia bacterium]
MNPATQTILLGVISSLIAYVISLLLSRYEKMFDKFNQHYSVLPLVIIWLFWAGTLILYFYLIQDEQVALKWNLLFAVIIAIGSFLTTWKRFKQYWKVGIRAVENSTRKKKDYVNDLKICKNKLEFLGVGASKLSETDEFETALHRCHISGEKVRFLLCNPRDKQLQGAALTADRDREKYEGVVLGSLRRINDLKNNRNFNIEVRFYKEFPIFRLMFIDDSLCIMSVNVLGAGDGRQLPHIYLSKVKNPSSLYRGMEQYYNEVWDASEEIDLDFILNSG